MKFTLSLTVEEDGKIASTESIIVFEKDCQQLTSIGLSLQESKQLLEVLQVRMVEEQAHSYVEAQLPSLPTPHPLKDYQPLTFRTLFGNVTLRSPRFSIEQDHHKTTLSPLKTLFSQRTSPELLYLETKWAALMPYAKTAELLKELLPIHQKLNAATIRNHLGQIAQQMDSQLSEEPFAYFEGSPRERALLPKPEGPIVIGVDGGYLRDWKDKKACFEVIAGKSMPTDQPSKCFGFVQGQDKKAKHRVFELLKSQGLQLNQEVVFLSDGAANLRQLQEQLTPNSLHILDWFHITMRFTVLQQYLLGLTKMNPEGEAMQKTLTSAKWHLWHGSTDKALELIIDVAWDLEAHQENADRPYDKIKPLVRYLNDLECYIRQNKHLIVDYSERYRYGEAISSGFVESTVNYLVAKRCNKKQQMQWSKAGVHRLLVVRAKVLNEELEFRKRYPSFRPPLQANIKTAA
jgi:hypothetical protein